MRKRKPGREGVPPGLLLDQHLGDALILVACWDLLRRGKLMAAGKVPARCEKLSERCDNSISLARNAKERN
jgi:hypothetical protein